MTIIIVKCKLKNSIEKSISLIYEKYLRKNLRENDIGTNRNRIMLNRKPFEWLFRSDGATYIGQMVPL